jgi:hypothetical protein
MSENLKIKRAAKIGQIFQGIPYCSKLNIVPLPRIFFNVETNNIATALNINH